MPLRNLRMCGKVKKIAKKTSQKASFLFKFKRVFLILKSTNQLINQLTITSRA